MAWIVFILMLTVNFIFKISAVPVFEGSEKQQDLCKTTVPKKSIAGVAMSYISKYVDDRLTLICNFHHASNSSVSWKKEDQDIITDPRKPLLSLRANKRVLVIRRVSLQSAGKYSCVVSNCRVSKTQSFIVEVHTHPLVRMPNIIVGPTDITVVEGQDAFLSCWISYSPYAPNALIWLKDGKVIHENPSVEWSTSKPEDYKKLFKIELRNVSLADSGVYACTAVGFYGGTATAGATLTVKTAAAV